MTSDNISGITGQIAGVSLSAFLQMIEMEQKTCTIKIFTKDNLGHIFFLNGTLIDSKTVNLKNLDALYDILSWDNIVIEVKKNLKKKQNHINLPLMHILIESTQLSDETKRTNDPKDSKNVTSTSINETRPNIINNNNFDLEIGNKLLINIDNQKVPFQSTLIGIERGEYLILKSPGPFGRIDHDLFNTENLIVKTLHKGTIYAFRSKLINTISKPSYLMFIEYPIRIEHHALRSHKRFKCSIVTKTKVNKKERNCVIENISKEGCLCIMEKSSKDINKLDNLINDTIHFRCNFPGSKEDVCFTGEIKNVKKESDEIAAGIKFTYKDSTDEVQNIIHKYIQLIEDSSDNV